MGWTSWLFIVWDVLMLAWIGYMIMGTWWLNRVGKRADRLHNRVQEMFDRHDIPDRAELRLVYNMIHYDIACNDPRYWLRHWRDKDYPLPKLDARYNSRSVGWFSQNADEPRGN